MRAFGRYVRSLNPKLPRAVWLLQAGGLANMFGNGVVVPYLVIYLHNVRGISLGLAGLIAAANGAAALVSGPIAGALADRIGARTTLVAALVIMTAAFALFPLITTAWHAFLLNALAGTGSGAFWPSQGTLLSALTPADRRPAAFAQQRVTMNLGIGLGGLVGGLIASTSDPSSFTVLFAVDAATFLVFAAILTRIPSPRVEPHAHESARGYAAVFRDRPFRSFILLNTLFIAASIAIFSELFPVFAKNEAGVSEREIGLIFFLNTALIVLAQLPSPSGSRGSAGCRRSPRWPFSSRSPGFSCWLAGSRSSPARRPRSSRSPSGSSPWASVCTGRCRGRSFPTSRHAGCSAATWRCRARPGRSASSSVRPPADSSSRRSPMRSGQSPRPSAWWAPCGRSRSSADFRQACGGLPSRA